MHLGDLEKLSMLALRIQIVLLPLVLWTLKMNAMRKMPFATWMGKKSKDEEFEWNFVMNANLAMPIHHLDEIMTIVEEIIGFPLVRLYWLTIWIAV